MVSLGTHLVRRSPQAPRVSGGLHHLFRISPCARQRTVEVTATPSRPARLSRYRMLLGRAFRHCRYCRQSALCSTLGEVDDVVHSNGPSVKRCDQSVAFCLILRSSPVWPGAQAPRPRTRNHQPLSYREGVSVVSVCGEGRFRHGFGMVSLMVSARFRWFRCRWFRHGFGGPAKPSVSEDEEQVSVLPDQTVFNELPLQFAELGASTVSPVEIDKPPAIALLLPICGRGRCSAVGK